MDDVSTEVIAVSQYRIFYRNVNDCDVQRLSGKALYDPCLMALLSQIYIEGSSNYIDVVDHIDAGNLPFQYVTVTIRWIEPHITRLMRSYLMHSEQYKNVSCLA